MNSPDVKNVSALNMAKKYGAACPPKISPCNHEQTHFPIAPGLLLVSVELHPNTRTIYRSKKLPYS